MVGELLLPELGDVRDGGDGEAVLLRLREVLDVQLWLRRGGLQTAFEVGDRQARDVSLAAELAFDLVGARCCQCGHGDADGQQGAPRPSSPCVLHGGHSSGRGNPREALWATRV